MSFSCGALRHRQWCESKMSVCGWVPVMLYLASVDMILISVLSYYLRKLLMFHSQLLQFLSLCIFLLSALSILFAFSWQDCHHCHFFAEGLEAAALANEA